MNQQNSNLKVTVCFIGGSRYNQPLDRTDEKKFETLSVVGKLFVIGFSQDKRLRMFNKFAHFYLLPQFSFPILRYITLLTAGSILGLWFVLRHDVKIFVAQSPYEGCAAALAKNISSWFGKRVGLIVESHGDFEASLFLERQIRFPLLYRALMRKFIHFALYRADALRAVSYFTRQQLEARSAGKPISQFPAWSDIKVFLNAGDLKKQKQDEKLILYVGVLIPRKGIHFLIDAFDKIANVVPESRLLIIGRTMNKEYAEVLKAKANKLESSGQIRFMDAIPQSELAEYMSSATVLVLPSVSEGMGRVILEAMACRTPVIGSRVGGILEMIVDKENGFLVPPTNIESLANSLQWILNHPQESREMGERGRKFAESFFSQEVYKRNYSVLFDTVSRILSSHKQI
jgi:glycosyltransferase involved in cell wall biosynthesis